MRSIHIKKLIRQINMDNKFIISGIISFLFLLFKFTEMRILEKESKPLKILIRDTFVVYVSAISSFFLMEQLQPVMDTGGGVINQPAVFIDNPSF